ncbi:hypothetical protein J5N97_008803 [Dioscorea zingiberensis]|uniref:Uncharacterized protein n=1 Tax=Dioscorea zingiberensis TaxID=325984 RepID=A0A9D5CWD7_9LILI|nr:hypothetical protein J5N97_008803 [Dioscorea zingiberensis]
MFMLFAGSQSCYSSTAAHQTGVFKGVVHASWRDCRYGIEIEEAGNFDKKRSGTINTPPPRPSDVSSRTNGFFQHMHCLQAGL